MKLSEWDKVVLKACIEDSKRIKNDLTGWFWPKGVSRRIHKNRFGEGRPYFVTKSEGAKVWRSFQRLVKMNILIKLSRPDCKGHRIPMYTFSLDFIQGNIKYE